MSVHDELVHARHALDDLLRAVDRLQIRLGNGPDVRRARADADHLREDLELLRQNAVAETPTPDPAQPQIVFIPRTPYDPSMWAGCEDEGIGSRHGPERRQTGSAHRSPRWAPGRS
ncbi:hypothetical protein [Streptomyces sp. HUAS ZL42]|uniref:hypothetical protein n=1 Tax=Streptomyces sp. HUAS ZL42 TaxID=3231715 RepID=UPI00345E1414